MANVSSIPVFNPINPTATADAMALERQRKLAEALQAQGLSKIEYDPNGAISPFQGLNKMAQALLGGQMQNAADEKSTELAKSNYDALAKAFGVASGGAPAEVDPKALGGALGGNTYGAGIPKLTGDGRTDMMLYSQSPDDYFKGVVEYGKPVIHPKTGEWVTPNQSFSSGGGAGAPKKDLPPEVAGMDTNARAEYEAEVAKDMAKRNADEGKKERNAGEIIRIISLAEQELPKATDSGAGALLAEGKKFIGKSDAQTQADRKLELYSGWLVNNVPRMEGPQSNFDVQNYQRMAADVGTRSLPMEDRLAALQGLKQLQSKYVKGGNVSDGFGGGGSGSGSGVSGVGALPPPKAGDVQQGYRFKGGDPSSPNSWEKM